MGLAKPQKSLKKWTNEDWGTRSGKNSTQGSKATGERYLPKKARQALSPQEYAATSASFNTRILNNSASVAQLSGSYLASSASLVCPLRFHICQIKPWDIF